MRHFGVVALIVASFALLGAGEPPAQVIHGASAEQVDYAALDRLPDWRGIWTPNFSPFGAAGEEPKPKGEFLKRYEAFKANPNAAGLGTRTSNCAVPGMPSVMSMPYDIEFLFTPGRVTIIQEAYMQVRRVYTDGRPLPEDPDPTFNGSSIGHWEGAVLVVETVGIKTETMLTRGLGHSEDLKITERFHLDPNDPNKLVLDTRIEDDKALKKPWHTSASYTRHREWDQLEFVCNENDRNPIGPDGATEYILRDGN